MNTTIRKKEKTKLLLGITGGIAAYKTPDLVRQLLDSGFDLKVIVTEGAKSFVSILSLQTLLPDRVFETLLEPQMQHIQLAKWADVILIAPATANSMAKLCAGLADDLLSAVCLATKAKLLIAPAMNQAMWQHAATQANIDILKKRGITFLGPNSGIQACGDNGPGRMMEPSDIVHHVSTMLHDPYLSGLKILITAGGTREPIDPVRYISNHSSGKMGYALAKIAGQLGATVTLISGFTSIEKPACEKCISVETAHEMREAILGEIDQQDIFISVAAVSDYTVEKSDQKIKRGHEPFTLTLIPTTDILAEVCSKQKKPFTVGFAAETQNVIDNAKQKRIKKGADIIVVNDVSQHNIGFGSDDNAVTVIAENLNVQIEKNSKENVAAQLLKIICDRYRCHISCDIEK